MTGRRGIVLVGGEPGIGKTRLAAEFAALLHGEGAIVLAGRCDEDMGVPYQPFVEALRHYVAHAAAPLRLGRYPGELARLLPELGEVVPGLPDPLRSDPETERYRLFDALEGWLGDLARESAPVLLVLDDIQWAAKPTLLLLRHILRSPEATRLLILATCRDTDIGPCHPLTDLLADLPRLEGAERLALSGLDRPGVEAFLEAAAGHDLNATAEALAEIVWRETEGNCFFVAEVLRHLAESGAVEVRNGRWVTTGGATLYDGLSDARRRSLHRRTAAAIESIHRDIDDHLPALAHHWSHSGADTDKAVEYAARAGNRAMALLAHDEAVRFYAEALRLAGPDADRYDLAISLGDAQHRAGDPAYRRTLLDAGHRAEAAGDGDALARAALAATRTGVTSSLAQLDDELVALLEAAATSAGTPTVKARLLATLAVELTYGGDHQRVVSLTDEALALARDVGDPECLAAVMANRIYSIMEPSTLRHRVELTADLLELAGLLRDPRLEFGAMWNRSRTLLETGSIAEAEEQADRCVTLADELGQPALRWMATWIAVGPALAAGRIDDAERLCDRAQHIGRMSSLSGTELVATVQRLAIRFEEGRVAEVEPLLGRFLDEYPAVPGLPGMLAWAAAEAGRFDRARAELAVLAERSFELPRDPAWLCSVSGAAEAAHRVGDRDAARALYRILEPWSEVWSNVAGFTMGISLYYLGILAATFGDTDLAERHLADAVARYEAAGAPAHLGRARVELARLLAARHDVDGARRLVDDALSEATGLGLVNVEQRARALLETL